MNLHPRYYIHFERIVLVCRKCGEKMVRTTEGELMDVVPFVATHNETCVTKNTWISPGQSVECLELSVRANNALRKNRIRTLADLTGKSRSQLLRFPGFGRRTVAEIECVLEDAGLSLSRPDLND